MQGASRDDMAESSERILRHWETGPYTVLDNADEETPELRVSQAPR